jgi:arylsulfatase A-like enzyme
MVSRMDGDVGDLLALLKSLNLEENTMVVFTSDNGHEFDKNFFNSNGDFRGKKRDLYEGGIRIPFMVCWPGIIQPNSQSTHISAFWDFLPTVCDLAGIKPSDNYIDGISYLPTLLGKEQKKHDYLYWEFNEGKGPIQAVRKGDWKAVKYLEKPLELYNLPNDIGEEHNVAKANPKIAEEMIRLMKEARTENVNSPLEYHERVLKKMSKQKSTRK